MFGIYRHSVNAVTEMKRSGIEVRVAKARIKLRLSETATVNDWSAICWTDGKMYKAKDYKNLEIMDRVGGGDSFASGLIYGLMTTDDVDLVVNYGAAHGALVMTTPGDTTMVSKREVEALMKGVGARVQR